MVPLHTAMALNRSLDQIFIASDSLFPMLEEQENEVIQEKTASLSRGFYQLLRLNCNLIALYSLQNETVRPCYAKTELCNFTADIFDRTESLFQTKSITLSLQLPNKTLFAWIDAQKLERAVLNLLSNAYKFTPEGGKVLLQLSRAGRQAMITVKDSGEGMSGEQLGTVFESFERPPLPGDPRCGLGVGLFLARSYAQLHKGNLLLHSAPDEGTTATLTFSLVEPTEEEKAFQSPVAQASYCGSYSHELVEFSDRLPSGTFDSRKI